MARNSSQDSKPERKYSNRYVEFLYHWDTTRRLKKSVAGPEEGYQHPNSIHGQRVLRLGKGMPPRDNNEQEFRLHRRKAVPNRSFESHSDILCPTRPATADACMHLHLDETRHRALLTASGRHNSSSLRGAGVVVASEPAAHKPWRGRGAANPGHGLSEEMTQTLSFNPQPQQEQQRPRKMVWNVATIPRTPVNILQHRMSDPMRESQIPKFEVQRPVTPNLHSCSTEERRTAFYAGLQMYARNKCVGEYGSLRTNLGLRTLAGYAS